MIIVRKSNDRGHANHGWLDSHHTFSFGSYHDPQHMGFSSLRVINQDRVAPGEGFGTHSHADMEIISYVVQGKLAHKDSMGSGSTLQRGDVQTMSAGTGVTHSEFNGDSGSEVHFLQIWVLPDAAGHKPRYGEKRFADEEKRNQLRLLVSGDGREGSLPINRDVAMFGSLLAAGKSLEYPLATGRNAWLQVVAGSLTLNGQPLAEGDGARISAEKLLQITATTQTELLLFDLD